MSLRRVALFAATGPLAVIVALIGLRNARADERGQPEQRARPPRWDQRALDAFFPNALEKLHGERPAWRAASASSIAGGSQLPPPGIATTEPTSSGGVSWSRLIHAETLEDEVKAAHARLQAATKSPSHFKAGGYKQARNAFALLAVLFAVIDEYDQQVRWQRSAARAAGAFQQAAAACREASDPAYQASRTALDDLQTLIRGGSLAPTSTAAWSQPIDRAALMLRMEQAQNQGLRSGTRSPADFAKHRDKLNRDAQVLALLARTLQQKGAESADDETYREYAQALEQYSQAVIQAAERDDYHAARSAASEIRQSCDACHGDYRG